MEKESAWIYSNRCGCSAVIVLTYQLNFCDSSIWTAQAKKIPSRLLFKSAGRYFFYLRQKL